jgi:hypothetical protein
MVITFLIDNDQRYKYSKVRDQNTEHKPLDICREPMGLPKAESHQGSSYYQTTNFSPFLVD